MYLIGSVGLAASGSARGPVRPAGLFQALQANVTSGELVVWAAGPRRFVPLSTLQAMASGAAAKLSSSPPVAHATAGHWRREVTVGAGSFSSRAVSVRLEPISAGETFLVLRHTITSLPSPGTLRKMSDVAGRIGPVHEGLTFDGAAPGTLSEVIARARSLVRAQGRPVFWHNTPTGYTVWAYFQGAGAPVEIAGKWVNAELVIRKAPTGAVSVTLGVPFVQDGPQSGGALGYG